MTTQYINQNHHSSSRDKGDKSREEKILKIAILLSLLVHLLFVVGIRIPLPSISDEPNEEKIRIVLNPIPEKKIEQVQEEQPNQNTKPNQIVATEEGRKEKPKDTRFLGEKDQTFDRQTVTKKIGSFKEAGQGVKEGVEQQKVAKENSQAKKQQKTETNRRQARESREQTKKFSFNDLAVGAKKVQPKALSKSQMANLGIKSGAAGKSGLSQNNDFVDDVPLGDMTNLNTVEYKYYGFNFRIRQKLEQYWGRELREQAELMWAKGRRIPGNQHRITSLEVYLDSNGNIVDIKVKGT